MAQTISTEKFGDLAFDSKSFLYDYNSQGDKVAGQFKIDGKQYTFIPQNIAEKGIISGDRQRYLGNLLVGDNLKALGTEGVYVDLAGVNNYDTAFEKKGWSTTGFLVPAKVASDRKLVGSVRSYEIGKDLGKGMKMGAIQGASEVGGKPVYATEPMGKAQSAWIQPPGTSGYDGQNVTGTSHGRYTYTKNKFGFLGEVVGGIGKAIGGIPFLPELIGFATGQPLVAAALRGAAGGAAGMNPLEAGLLGGLSAAGVQAGLNVQAGVDPITGAATSAPAAAPAAVGGTPGVSQVFPVVPPQVSVAPLAPAATLGAGAGATGGLLGADAAFAADYASTLAGQGLSEAAIAQNLAEAGINTANSTLAANLATAGSGATEIANTLASLAPAGTSSLFSGTAADLANFGITAGGAGVALTPSQLQAIQAGRIAGGTFAEQVANAQNLLPAGIGAGTAAAGGGLLDSLGDAAKGLLGTDLSNMLGSLLNAGIDYETAKRIADQARAEGRSSIDKAQELGRQGQLPQSVLDNLNTLASTTAQQFREAGAAAQVPFTPYTVTTGAGTATTGPGQATATAAGPYAQIQQQAQQQAFNTLTAMNPAQASQTLFDQMQALTQPAQQRQQQQLLGTLGQRGLLGFGQNMPTVGGATRTVNPLLESLLSAQGTERAQQGLQATQFGTSEAQRQAALSQALTAQAQGIDQQTFGLLGQAGQFGRAEQDLAQANAARQFQATTAGLGLPLSTAIGAAGMQQRGLEFAASAGLRGQQSAIPLQLQAGLIEAGRTQNLADLSRSAVNELFR
jgi:hypothetical protein